MKKSTLLKLMNFWPPFVGAGIRVKKISPDFLSVDVEMKLRFYNRNYVGTHFGGSLYAMCDPFYMLMLIENLGSDYIVWDKAANIRFLKPARSRVRANFHITPEEVDHIRIAADQEYKVEPQFSAAIYDDANDIIAVVDKLLYVRRKDRRPN